MGIRVTCPNGHALHLKSFLAGKKGICPKCGVKFRIPADAATEPDADPATETRREAPAKAATHPSGSARPAARSGLGAAFEAPIDELLSRPVDEADDPFTSTRVETKPRPQSAGAERSPSADPLSEDPTAQWYMQCAGGERFGPALADEVKLWLQQGRMGADALVWRSGWGDWRTASKVFAGLPAQATPAPTGGEAPQLSQPIAQPKAATRRRSARRMERSLTSVVVLTVVVLVLAIVLAVVVLRGG